MIASLYISDHSFLYNGSDSNIQVEKKLLNFNRMIDYVKQFDDNHFFYNANKFLQTVILKDDITIGDILNSTRNNQYLHNDCKLLFFKLFKFCKKTTVEKNKDFIEYLKLESDKECNGILVLNKQEDLPCSLQIISTIEGWLDFRRFYLGKYPKDSRYFISESKKYFNHLLIHEQNSQNYLKDILDSHSNRLVHYLSALNDHFLCDFSKFNGDLIQFLPVFSSRYGIDDASFEGTKKDKFKCTFQSEDNGNIEVYCEPHLKMQKDDKGNRKQLARIYFKAPLKSDTFIYIGFICRHL